DALDVAAQRDLLGQQRRARGPIGSAFVGYAHRVVCGELGGGGQGFLAGIHGEPSSLLWNSIAETDHGFLPASGTLADQTCKRCAWQARGPKPHSPLRPGGIVGMARIQLADPRHVGGSRPNKRIEGVLCATAGALIYTLQDVIIKLISG